MAVTWIKDKYRRPKVAGRYKSSHSDSAKKTKKVGNKLARVGESKGVRTLLVNAATGKRLFVWK